ncbi:MAG: ABC transporter permease [Pseudomonadales bacterium]|nr:ABC transporter permease [Pseudomonadales bacterium]
MSLWFDLKYAVRLLTRNLGHSALCVFAVALSLAISLVVFALAYNTTYRPYEFQDSENWTYLYGINTDSNTAESIDSVNLFTYQVMQESLTAFSEFGAIRAAGQSRLNDGETTRRVSAVEITPNLLQTANLSPLLGRTLVESDGVPGAERVVVLSHSIWEQYYAADEGVVGTQTNLDEIPHTIVGVMPEGVSFPFSESLWLPFRWPVATQPAGQVRITPVGVLHESATLESLNVEISGLLTRLSNEFPDYYGDHTSARANYLTQLFFENGGSIGTVLVLATAVIVILACLNIGNLLITRSLERRGEFAIRSAVGSSDSQLIRQGLLESLLVCVIGATLGLLLTLVAFDYINSIYTNVASQLPGGVPQRWRFVFDGSVVAASLVATAVIWLCSGLFPAWRASRMKASDSLMGDAHSTTDRSGTTLIKLLVGGEVITSCFLLIVSGILVAAIVALANTDYGIEEEGLMTANIELPRRYMTTSQRFNFIESLQGQLQSDVAVTETVVVSDLPTRFNRRSGYTLSDREVEQNDSSDVQYVAAITSNYFQLLDVPLVEGRQFDATDSLDSQPVIIIDEAFAARLWPAESPLGKQIQITELNDGIWRTIVGVTDTIKQGMPLSGLDRLSTLYLPISQVAPFNTLSVVAETTYGQSDYERLLREAITAVDRDIAIYDIKPMASVLNETTQIFTALRDIFIAISLFTLLLAGTGIFGVISRSVVQRTREIGIRRALGSSNIKVIWMYLRQGVAYLLAGLVIGGGAALLVGGALATIFTDVGQSIPFVFVTVTLLLSGLIIAASYFPARQVVALEPGEALHHD